MVALLLLPGRSARHMGGAAGKPHAGGLSVRVGGGEFEQTWSLLEPKLRKVSVLATISRSSRRGTAESLSARNLLPDHQGQGAIGSTAR